MNQSSRRGHTCACHRAIKILSRKQTNRAAVGDIGLRAILLNLSAPLSLRWHFGVVGAVGAAAVGEEAPVLAAQNQGLGLSSRCRCGPRA